MHQCPGSPDSEQSGEVQSTIEIDRQLLFSEWLVIMQNPNEDTEWNDVLRAKGIIPEKPKEAEVTEEQLLAMVEQTIKEKSGSKCTVSVGSRQK